MANLNKVLLVGNLTRDPEVRYLPSGKAVADLGLAINENYKNKNGEMVESAVFVDVVVWERQAETAGEYLKKGSPVLVEGRLQLDEWKTKEGEKRSKLRVRAERVQFLSAPRRDGEPGGAPSRRPSAGTPESMPESSLEQHPADHGDDENLPF